MKNMWWLMFIYFNFILSRWCPDKRQRGRFNLNNWYGGSKKEYIILFRDDKNYGIYLYRVNNSIPESELIMDYYGIMHNYFNFTIMLYKKIKKEYFQVY